MLQRRYGVATTVYFTLITKGATDLMTGATAASGDIKISKDGGAFANTTTATFTEEGHGWYSVPLTATEMEARQIMISVIDQTGPKAFEDQAVLLHTVNHASAEIPTFSPTAADVRSAVGLASANLDTQLAAIDDAVDTEVAAVLAAVDTEVAAIKAKTDNLPADTAAEFAAIPTAIENADALLTRDVDNVEASAPVHSLTGAILKLVSRFVGSTGVTYRTNGSTTFMTQTPTTNASADPISEIGVAS